MLLSIIVPVYQAEQYIVKLIDSIVEQSFRDYELLLIDDGSTDNSSQICDDYAERHKQIRTIHKCNGGVSDARNTGLNEAVGEYVIFADADDWYEKNAFSLIVEKCKDRKIDLLIFGHYIVRNNKKIESMPPFDGGKSMESLKINIQKYLYSESANPVWNKVFRRELINRSQLCFPNQKIGEDAVFSYSYLKNCNAILFDQRCIYNYYQNTNSAVNSFCTTRWKDEKSLIKFISMLLIEWNYEENEIEKLLANKFRNAILFELYNVLADKCQMSFIGKVKYLNNFVKELVFGKKWGKMSYDGLSSSVCIQILLLKLKMSWLLIMLMQIKRRIYKYREMKR